MEEPVKVADILVEKVLDHMAIGQEGDRQGGRDKVFEERPYKYDHKYTIFDEYKSQRTYR